MLTFLFMTIDQKDSDYIINRIQDIDKGITEKLQKKINRVFEVFGEFDIVLKLKSHDEDDAHQTVKKIKEIPGVKSIQTFIVEHPTVETDQPSKEKIIYH